MIFYRSLKFFALSLVMLWESDRKPSQFCLPISNVGARLANCALATEHHLRSRLACTSTLLSLWHKVSAVERRICARADGRTVFCEMWLKRVLNSQEWLRRHLKDSGTPLGPLASLTKNLAWNWTRSPAVFQLLSPKNMLGPSFLSASNACEVLFEKPKISEFW